MTWFGAAGKKVDCKSSELLFTDMYSLISVQMDLTSSKNPGSTASGAFFLFITLLIPLLQE